MSEIESFNGSTKDGRCLEVWFKHDVTPVDRAWLLAAINEKTARERNVVFAQEAWRPIETAPDDDTEILISGFDPEEGEKSRYVSTGCKVRGHYYQSYWDNWTVEDRLFNPTHWMPLPSLPAHNTTNRTPDHVDEEVRRTDPADTEC